MKRPNSLASSIVRQSRGHGFTLVELMVAMIIGLLLIGATISVFISTQQTNRTQEAMSRVQESGRYAIEMIAREARMAGYGACAGIRVHNILDQSDPAYDPALHSSEDAFSYMDPPNGHVRGDVLVVNQMRLLTTELEASGSSGGGGGNVPPIGLVQNESGIEQGTILMVSAPDGSACDLFQQTTTSSASNLQRAAGGQSPGNLSSSQVRYSVFTGPIEVSQADRSIFYIGESKFSPGTPSLYQMRESNNNTPVEIVEGVYDMRIEYGRDTNNDGQVDDYVSHENTSATDDWSEFVAVRIHFLVHNGTEQNVVDEARENLYFAGGLFDAPDRRLYQTFTTTIAARNRLE